MADKTAAYGAALKKYIDAAFTTIAGVKDLTGPSLSAAAIEVTTHDSADAHLDFVAGLVDGGEITFTLEFDPSDTANQVKILDDMQARTMCNYQIAFADDGAALYQMDNCIVTGFTPNQPVDGSITADVTLKVNGKPDLTAT